MKSYFIFLLVFTQLALADVKFVRWTYQTDTDASLSHIVQVLNNKVGLKLTEQDFRLIERRPLANNYFQMFSQVAGGLPISGQNIRIWTGLKTGKAIQVEARIDTPPAAPTVLRWAEAAKIDSGTTIQKVREAIRSQGDDTLVHSVVWTDEWRNGVVVRNVKAKGKHGNHRLVLSVKTGKVLEYRYEEFPQADITLPTAGVQNEDEFSLPVQVYPIWEEYEGVAPNTNRVKADLKYLHRTIRQVEKDPYGQLATQKFYESKYDPVKGLTEEGQKLGFWSMAVIKDLAAQIYNKLPAVENDFAHGVFLEGRYATISLHPSVSNLVLYFIPGHSGHFRPNWVPRTDGVDEYEMLPESGRRGRPLKSQNEAWDRQANRDPEHNPVRYINDGFDELQVYWSVTQLMDSLHNMGFTDPELSTRQFHAYLYDNDISMRDNAYYTDDTINFTTYSPKEHNMARDNTTIWHELGHGVMDRLMGDHIRLADTGGLSEGMADFVAQLVLNDVTEGKPFEGQKLLRIFNKTGFNLTNEVHDDGEAYGGAMNDMLVAAMEKEGKVGLHKVTDITLEAMRLSRNHPALTANDWFDHMLFADEMGNLPLRRPGELRSLLLQALNGRNFNLDASPVAVYTLKNGAEEVTATGEGSRPRPIKTPLKKDETKVYSLTATVKGTPTYGFKFPVTVKVALRGGPLQGGIHWAEESDTPREFVLKSESDVAQFDLTATGVCDEVNRPDGSCVDFAYVQIWNNGDTDKPVAKKRFYLRVFPQE